MFPCRPKQTSRAREDSHSERTRDGRAGLDSPFLIFPPPKNPGCGSPMALLAGCLTELELGREGAGSLISSQVSTICPRGSTY